MQLQQQNLCSYQWIYQYDVNHIFLFSIQKHRLSIIELKLYISSRSKVPNMNMLMCLILLISIVSGALGFKNSMFYCGFSGDYCGQSKINDVHPSISTVILAFVNTLPDGKVIIDAENYPGNLTEEWKRSGKEIIISVGGQNGNWAFVFANENSITNFINSLVDIVQKYKLDGVDLDIQSYLASPRTVANMIIKLKQKLNQIGRKILIVSPEDVAIYQGSPVPSPDAGGQPFNYFVPIVQLADQYIDIYQPQAYNNWYDGLPGGSLDYFKDVYLNWRNLQGLSPWGKPIPNFAGIKPEKLRLGLLASRQAGGAAYYGEPSTIEELKGFLRSNNYQMSGFMIWDSHWDQRNQYAISKVCSV